MKSVKVKRVSPLEGPTGLLDGGATHPLRRGTPQELSVAEDVVVELAHGSITLKQHPITGTIFSDRAIEPIVPLRSLIELNYSIRWSSSGCEIRHPTRGTIECWLRNGCPTVTEQNALSLIADIERLKMIQHLPLGSESTLTDEVDQWWSSRFPKVPKRIWNYMVGQNDSQKGVHLPWNRAQRRRHATAKALSIHLYAGTNAKDWVQGWPPNVEVITVDTHDGQNIHDPQVWAYLWSLAKSGRVIAVIGGPPCRSVSRLLEQRPGPPRLRGRSDESRFGLAHLTDAQQQKADADTAMYLKLLGLYVQADESWSQKHWVENMDHVKPRVGFLLESPQDPATYLQNNQGDDAASFWAWEETDMFHEMFMEEGMKKVSFDQKVFGHCQRKPTTCLTNLPDMETLHECRSTGHEPPMEMELHDRMNQTASWAAWSPGLKAAIRAACMVLVEWYGLAKPRISKMLDLEGWKLHYQNNHPPYRRDCRVCAAEMASAGPHRRRLHGNHSSWSMSIDLVVMPKARDPIKTGMLSTCWLPLPWYHVSMTPKNHQSPRMSVGGRV